MQIHELSIVLYQSIEQPEWLLTPFVVLIKG